MAALRVTTSGLVGGTFRRAASNKFRFQSLTSSARAVIVNKAVRTVNPSKSFATFIELISFSKLRESGYDEERPFPALLGVSSMLGISGLAALWLMREPSEKPLTSCQK